MLAAPRRWPRLEDRDHLLLWRRYCLAHLLNFPRILAPRRRLAGRNDSD